MLTNKIDMTKKSFIYSSCTKNLPGLKGSNITASDRMWKTVKKCVDYVEKRLDMGRNLNN